MHWWTAYWNTRPRFVGMRASSYDWSNPLSCVCVFSGFCAAFSFVCGFRKNVIHIRVRSTYTSTKTGKAASRSSDRQLGGYISWTCARVPCSSVISKQRFFGSANLSKCARYDELPVLNSSWSSRFVFVEWTPKRMTHTHAHKKTKTDKEDEERSKREEKREILF